MKPVDRLSDDSQLMYVFLHMPVATLFSKSKHLVISAHLQVHTSMPRKEVRWFKTCQLIVQNVNVDISTRLTTMHGCHGLLVFNLLT